MYIYIYIYIYYLFLILCSAGAPRIHHPMGSNGEHHAPAERQIYGIAQRRRGCLAHATTKVRAPFNARTPDER